MNIHMNKDLQVYTFWCQKLKMFWVTFDFERTYIEKWENGYFTVTLAALPQETKGTSN